MTCLKPKCGQNVSGWNIERAYNRQVLMHNWFEERLQKENLSPTTYMRKEYPWYSVKPNVILRRKSVYPYKDLPKEKLFGHHGNLHDDNLITWYDENYNKRSRPTSQILPPLRKWDGRNLCWYPEKSDFPIKGRATNWGLKEATLERHKSDAHELSSTKYLTSYDRDYFYKTDSQPSCRTAVPKIYVPE